MLLTIQNLPSAFRYTDVKGLLKETCGLTDIILDNLLNEGAFKKVTVGLADDKDAALVMMKIDGLFLNGQRLVVKDIRNDNKKVPEQPFHNLNIVQPYQFMSEYGSNMSVMHQNRPPTMVPPPSFDAAPSTSMYSMPKVNAFTGCSNQIQQPATISSYQAVSNNQQRKSYDYTSIYWRKESPRSPQNVNERYSPNFEDSIKTKYIPSHDSIDRQRLHRSNEGSRHRSRSPRRNSWSSRDHSSKDNYYKRESSTRNKNNGYDSKRYDNYNHNRDSNQQHIDTGMSSLFGSNNLNYVNNQGSQVSTSNHGKKENVRIWENAGPSSWRQNNGKKENEQIWENAGPSPWRQNNEKKGNERNWENAGPSPGKQDNSSLLSKYLFIKKIKEDKDNYRWNKEFRQMKMTQKNRTVVESKAFKSATGFIPGKDGFKPNKQKPDKDFKSGKRSKQSSDFKPVKESFKPGKGFKTGKGGFKLGKEGLKPGKKGFVPGKGFKTGKAENKSFIDLKAGALVHKDRTWRDQATSQIIKEIMSASGQVNIMKKIQMKLKTCVKSRIDVMLEEKIAVPKEKIVQMYRKKYRPRNDRKFFEAVVKIIQDEKKDDECDPHVKSNMLKKTDLKQSDVIDVDEQEHSSRMIDVDGQQIASDVIKVDDQKHVSDVIEVDGQKNASHLVEKNKDKNVFKVPVVSAQSEMKKENDLYPLPEDLQKAYDDELNNIVKLYKGELLTPENDDDKIICKQLFGTIPTFKKALTLTITERLLNIYENLTLRVFCSDKFPSRSALEKNLKPLGVMYVTEVFKNMFIAVCNTFESYDKLCLNENIVIGNKKIVFKPLYLTEPIPKKFIKSLRKKFIRSQIDYNNEKFKNVEMGTEPIASGSKIVNSDDSDSNINTNNNVTSDKNINTDNNVTSDNNINTGNNVTSDNNINTGNNVTSDNNINTDNIITSDNNINTDNNVTSDSNINTDNSVNNGSNINIDNDANSDNNFKKDDNINKDNNINNDTNVKIDDIVNSEINVNNNSNVDNVNIVKNIDTIDNFDNIDNTDMKCFIEADVDAINDEDLEDY